MFSLNREEKICLSKKLTILLLIFLSNVKFSNENSYYIINGFSSKRKVF